MIHIDCNTKQCCNTCNDNPKDWYLVSFSPWLKTFFNPNTGETKHINYKEIASNGNIVGIYDGSYE